MIALYFPGDSPLHRLAAGTKLLVLAIAGTVLFFIDSIGMLALATLVVAVTYHTAGITPRQAWRQLRHLAWLPIMLLLVHVVVTDWLQGVAAVLRFTTLVAFAVLVTLTTRSTDLIAVLVRWLQPLGRFGLPTERIALMLSMTLRYIPLIHAGFLQVREARLARGAPAGTFAVLLPLLVRSLRQADELADAIDARGYDPQQ